MSSELPIWASTVVTDAVTNTDNRREILDEEALNGWVRDGTISTQQLNSLFYYLTLHSAPYANCPYLMSTTTAVPTNALEMDGSVTLTSDDNPNLYSIYGDTLPDLSSDAPSGHRWVIRNT